MAERRPGWLARRGGAPGEEFQALFAALPEGLALLDAAGLVQVANPALGRMAGPALPLRPGLPAALLLREEARPSFAALLSRALAGETPPPLAAAPADPLAAADTSWELAAEPWRGGGGAAGGALLLRVTDRTAALRAEARLATAGRFETVGKLAGGIAHDFNNLLAIILGSAAALREAGLTAAQAEDLGALEDAARRGAGLVAQLLAFAQQQPVAPLVLDLNAALRGMAPLLRRLLGGRIALELALEEPGRRVRIDPGQLDQLVLNLVANACQAMAEGGRLRLATGHAVVLRPEGEGPGGLPPGRYAVLEVADSGAGIPPEILPRLFEPFFTTRPEKGGTGLGLATVQGIVAQAGGQITVASRVGEGTSFRIHLPRQEAPAELPVGQEGAAPPEAAPVQAAPGPVLLVDDEAPLARLGEALLRRAGYQVVVADSAESALEAVEKGLAPAALVSDVAMPGEDGLALARRLRQRWPGLPVLLLSGYAESLVGTPPAAEGFRFLAKPFAPAALRQLLAEMLPGVAQSG
ncbi:PAS domain-containing sensor histidine kinase [Siccirubricoccus phaeus]|uniref:PAS domain-containing sensor histidine kinase n=1 Tax=Siccirubricoccus phaeus TaxID=2595053 RepID=UPI0011F0E140|nr:PAS domain-containing sensor histidine kinase [Siccirubricoccus phaeus]